MKNHLITLTILLIFLFLNNKVIGQDTTAVFTTKSNELLRGRYLIFKKNSATVNMGTKKEPHNAQNSYKEKYAKEWYNFEIPQVINGSNISPLPVDYLSSDFGDSELSAQHGFTFRKSNYKTTGSMGLSIAATDGIAVLAKSDNSPVNWGFKVGVSQILKHLILCESEAGVKTYLPSDKKTHPKTTEKVVWTTFNFNWKRTPYNIFDTLALFDDITQKVKTNTWSAIISLNRYSYTTQETNRFFRRIIWSLGAGYVKVNNYDQLEERTMEQVKLPTRTNSNGTYSRQIVESTSGAIGNFIEYKGLGVYGELYYPLFKKSKERGSVFFGARASYYESGEILNAVTGLYFNLKNGKIDKSEPDNPAPDAVNFSITGQFNSIKNSRGEDNKGSKHLTAVSALVLQVAVPLRFSGK